MLAKPPFDPFASSNPVVLRLLTPITLALLALADPFTVSVCEPMPVATVKLVPVSPAIKVVVPSYTLLALRLTVAGVMT